MPQALWENLDAFLQVAEFATIAAISRDGVQLREVAGIFDDPYLNAELGEYELDTSRPRLTCKWSDISDVLRGDVVRLDGRDFDVLTNAQPDGTGMGILQMAAVDP
nr:MAG TPA: Tail attachment protein [Caudoviricetes sp.]